MTEEQIFKVFDTIATGIITILGSGSMSPEQLREEINDVINPYEDEFDG